MKIFEATKIDYYFQLKKNDFLQEIEKSKNNYLSNSDFYKNKYKVKELEILKESLQFSNIKYGVYEEKIYKPNNFYQIETNRKEGYMVTGIFKYSGDINIIKYNSINSRLFTLDELSIVQERLSEAGFKYCIDKADYETLKINKDKAFLIDKYWTRYNDIVDGITILNNDVKELNPLLEEYIETKLIEHNEAIKEVVFLNELLEINLPKTTAYVEKIRPLEKKLDHNEITLKVEDYNKINAIIYDVCSTFETYPQTFIKLSEEEIRDIIVSCLSTHYVNRVGAETFVRNGKTDIHIYTEGKSNYIAECKIWNGGSVLLDTIEQLLSYATWKHTKTTIIFFNRNTRFKDVLVKIRDIIKGYDGYVETADNAWDFKLERDGQTYSVRLFIFNFK